MDFYLKAVAETTSYITGGYSLQEILLAPVYIYRYFFVLAYVLYQEAANHPILSGIIVALIVLYRTYARDHESAVNGTLTLVSIYHPHKSKITFLKCLFFACFAPYYPLYVVATKGTIYLVMAYMLPYMLIRRLFDKNYLQSGPVPDTKARYRRIYHKEPTPSFWDKYVKR